MVTGASINAATAFATANRSPDGGPPSDGGSASPTSNSASTVRSTAASWAQDAPVASPSRTTCSRSNAAASAGVTSSGSRTTSTAAPRCPSSATNSSSCSSACTPTASTSARNAGSDRSKGSQMWTPPMGGASSMAPCSGVRNRAPRSSRMRRKLDRVRTDTMGSTLLRLGSAESSVVVRSDHFDIGIGVSGQAASAVRGDERAPGLLEGDRTPCRFTAQHSF